MITTRSVAVDDERWEDQAATFRVYFWEQTSPPSPPYGGFWRCEPLQVLGARDVIEVFEWARANAGDRSFTIYIEVERVSNHGLVQVYGVDPTRAVETMP